MQKTKGPFLAGETIEEQYAFMAQVRQLIGEDASLLGGAAKAMVITYGCQQNENDSEMIRGMLVKMGFSITEDKEQATFVLLNTCAIRDSAEKKVYGKLGEFAAMKRENPQMIVALCGCMAQQEHVQIAVKQKYRQVDLVFATHSLYMFPKLLYQALRERQRIFSVDQSDGHIAEGLPVQRNDPFRANVPIMYGCNNFCSYCVVPFVRGRERSRRPENILEEIRALAAAGVKDITLLGQNVNSYGKTLEEPMSFPELLYKINDIEGDFRLRFMTSHPKDATDELFSAIRDCAKLVRHVHLPIQSGSNRVLSQMNRGYTRESYLEKLSRLRSAVPEVSVTSDIIVGFPTETEEEFLETISLVKAARFDLLYTFLYSKRPGTPAFSMEGQIAKSEQQRRFDLLLKEQNQLSRESNNACIGTVQRVLVEGESKNDPEMMTGRSDANKVVNFKADKGTIGQFLSLKITDCKTWWLLGEQADKG